MPEQTVVTGVSSETIVPTQTATTTVESTKVTESKPSEDLMSRVAKFKPAQQTQEGGHDKFSDAELVKAIDSIQDDGMKQQLSLLRKNLITHNNNKSQELSEQLKKAEITRLTYEQEMKKLNQTWTPERIKQLTSDPEFRRVAEQVVEGMGSEDDGFNSLPKAEQQKILAVEQKLAEIQQQNNELAKQKEDEQLKLKYPNYNPQTIDNLFNDLTSGRIKATREHLYKVQYFDEAIHNAYELGKIDAVSGNNEKLQSSSVDGIQTFNTSPLVKDNNERNDNFIKRLFEKNLNRKL